MWAVALDWVCLYNTQSQQVSFSWAWHICLGVALQSGLEQRGFVGGVLYSCSCVSWQKSHRSLYISVRILETLRLIWAFWLRDNYWRHVWSCPLAQYCHFSSTTVKASHRDKTLVESSELFCMGHKHSILYLKKSSAPQKDYFALEVTFLVCSR